MTLQFNRPMLAAPLMPPNVECTDENILAAMEKLRYPVLATLKKDGIRALRLSGSLLSRTLKPIPNKSIRERSLILPGGFDMELWNPSLSYDEVESIVMSREHELSNHIGFHLLDTFANSDSCSYVERMYWLNQWNVDYQMSNDDASLWPSFQHPVEWSSPLSLFNYFTQVEYEQGEGICFRTPNSPYKQGRSTLKEQYLVKLCRYIQSEATVIGFEEQCENTNRSKWNAVGRMDRSKTLDGQVGKDTLGAFLVRDTKTGVEYKVGTGVGLTDNLRKHIWQNRSKYEGQVCLVKHKPHGQKNKPRSPIWKGWRKEIDIV